MASFEPRERRICIRIVYDGLGAAGKTTNLQQLASLFSAQRTSDLYSPATVDGRTLYFDWMQIHGGVACGFPLLCQVISVPGQVVLTERRRHLLATADAVVYVCDSAHNKVADAKNALALVGEATRENDEPPVIVVQANKQDQLASVDGAMLREALGLADDIEVVEAIARDAIGVVDSFVAAVRGVTKRLQAQVDRNDARLELRIAERPDDLKAALDDLEIDPEWAAEMLLEEAAASFASFEERVVAREVLAPAPALDDGREHVPLPRPDTPAGFVWPAHTARAKLEGLADAGVASAPIRDDGTVSLRVGDLQLTTSRSDCFIEADHARQSIVRAARELTQLAGLLAPDTVLALQISEEGQLWLWTVRPVLEPASAWLAHASSDAERETRLGVVAGALADALAYTTQRHVELDTALEHFGVDGGQLRYIGPRRPADASSVSKMAEAALKSIAQTGAELARFMAALEVEVARRAVVVKLPAPARPEWRNEAGR